MPITRSRCSTRYPEKRDRGCLSLLDNVWGSEKSYYNFTPDSTNLTVDPMMVNIDSSLGKMDFHLQMFSPLIDKGDPNVLDKDGSRSDIGLFGGPFGEEI